MEFSYTPAKNYYFNLHEIFTGFKYEVDHFELFVNWTKITQFMKFMKEKQGRYKNIDIHRYLYYIHLLYTYKYCIVQMYVHTYVAYVVCIKVIY